MENDVMKKLIALFLISFGLLIACQKELSKQDTDGTLDSPQTMMLANQKKMEVKTVNASNAISVITSNQSRFGFDQNSFVDMDGNPVSGNIELHIKEILTPADMILNGVPSMSDDKPLASGGEFRVLAFQNGKALKLAPGKFMSIQLPPTGRDLSNMSVFNGRENADSSVNWVQNTNPGNFVLPDSITTANLFCDSINWVNCDRFIGEPNFNYSVEPGNCPDLDKCQVFLHLGGLNSVMRIYRVAATGQFQTVRMIANTGTVIGLTTRNGHLYAAIHKTTFGPNSSTAILNFVPMSEDELRATLQNLQ